MRSLSLLVLLALPCLAADSMPPAADRQLARDIFKQIVEIKSGYTTGATTPVAEAIAARLKAEGFPDPDIFVGGAIPTKANVIVRYHGTGARKPILLLAHEDVVEARREDWSLDPFTFTEQDRYFYGRGTMDDKAQAAIWIANLIRYKREGLRPDRDIIVALTADEEGGGPYNGVDWLLKNHRDLIDAELALNEGGFGEELNGKRIDNQVQPSEKYMINFRLEVHNKGGHSSMPVPDNAIYHLAGALDRLSKFGFPLKTNEVTREYFARLADFQAGPLKNDFTQGSQGSTEAMTRVAAVSPMWNSMLRTTCVATQLEGGHAMNALPQLAAATVNCRVLPEDSVEHVQSTLERVFDDKQVTVKIAGDVSRGPASPLNPALMKTVARITDSLWPGVPTVPVMLVAATDGRFLRAAGIPTYGVQGFFIDINDIRMHGRDERLSVRSFYEGQTFLYELVKSLSTPNSGP
ncbi:MAG: M20/M25/M40 family metallo-hydrolase [Acidobacteriaceae bacterium]|nr:M20/M25/M40 family metallo-hydrolase [Acidobacteriaceae bacterium]